MVYEGQYRKTVAVPLQGEAQMPLLSDQEREAFIQSLKEAEASAERGEFIVFERERFLTEIRADYARHRNGQ